MPYYDLHCKKCEQAYNIRATIAEKSANLIPCPDCGSLELETLFLKPPAQIAGKSPAHVPCGQQGGCGARCPNS